MNPVAGLSSVVQTINAGRHADRIPVAEEISMHSSHVSLVD